MSKTSNYQLFKKTFQYLRRYKKLAVLVGIFSLGASLFESFTIGSLVPILQSVIAKNTALVSDFGPFEFISVYLGALHPNQAVIYLLLVAAALLIIKNLFTYLNAITINRASNAIRRDLQMNLFRAVVGANVQFFDSIRVGHLVGSISVYTEKISEFIFSALNLATQLFRMALYVTLLLLISFKLTVAAFVAVAVILPLIQWILRRIQKIGFATARAVSELHARMVEMFGNIRLMKMFNTERFEERRFSGTVEDLKKNYIHAALFSNLFRPVSEIFLALLLVGLMLLNISYFNVDLAARLPFIIVYVYLFIQVFTQLATFNNLRGKLAEHNESFVAYERVIAEAKTHVFTPGANKPAVFEKEIQLAGVSFSYRPDQPVLENVSLTIPRGKFVALVGPTGAGKSTVISLIAGLYRPQTGAVLVDAVPLCDIELSSWLKKIGFVSQDIILFNDTIRNNIAYGLSGIKEETVMKAAAAAHIHEYIQSLPEGYDTIVGERGVKLSGGQKQRLSIARALVRDPEMLILDEATSSLDSETEQVVQENLKALAGGKTVIAIAHRLSTIQRADTIFVLNNGTVVEQGNHQELVARQSFYSHFYYLQFNT